MSNFDLTKHFVIETNKPAGSIKDTNEMYRRSPVSKELWVHKRPDMMKIDVSVFITGSDSSSIYTMGAMRGWLEVPHEKKWIRWTLHQEWSELYCDPHADKELHSYLDEYLRGIDNEWEKMSKLQWLRLSTKSSSQTSLCRTQYKESHLSQALV